MPAIGGRRTGASVTLLRRPELADILVAIGATAVDGRRIRLVTTLSDTRPGRGTHHIEVVICLTNLKLDEEIPRSYEIEGIVVEPGVFPALTRVRFHADYNFPGMRGDIIVEEVVE